MFEDCQFWRQQNGFGEQLPIPDPQVAAFVESIAASRGPGVAGKYLAAVAKVHLFEGFFLPRSPLLKALAKALDIQQKRRSNPDRTDALPPAAVVALWEKWQEGSLPKLCIIICGDSL